MKKFFLIILGFIIVLNIIIYVFLSLTNKPSQPTQPATIPTPTIFEYKKTSPTLTQDYTTEKQAETIYANERQRILEEKPWLLKLPLKSENYFISYNPEKNSFLVTIYYYTTNILPKNQQLDIAKQEVINAILNLGVNLDKEGIIYTETAK